MTDKLEDTSFDIIVLGTGLVESIVAGSLARSGKKVLHLDSNQHYGSGWSVFNFKNLLDWEQQLKNKDDSASTQEQQVDVSTLENNTTDTILKAIKDTLSSSLKHHASELSPSDVETYLQPSIDQHARLLLMNKSESKQIYDVTPALSQLNHLVVALKLSRHYNLDTTPKILPSRGDLVEILIRSGVGRYMEFKSVDDMYVFDHDDHRLEKVPGSKEDIFVNKSISLIDKRKLMKFLKFTVDEEKDMELLKVSAPIGFERTQSFMKSMGRFGKGAYLCTLYGGGSEISQAFCRICAVYGGVYILGQPLSRYIIDEETSKCTGVATTDGQVFTASHIISGLDYLSPKWEPSSDVTDDESSWISRGFLVTNKPPGPFNQTNDGQSLGISIIPPNDTLGNKDDLIYMLNQSSETMACPKNQFVTYLWTPSNDPTKETTTLKDIKPFLLQQQRSTDEDHQEGKVIFEVYYKQRIRSSQHIVDRWNIPDNVYVCSDPDASVDFEQATKEARSIFYRCVTEDVEFMPPAEEAEGDD
ncbi:hypothetical protein BCR42DRAFT_314577 [Absidia repens]|uniref:Rab proteins geranylgeranyltransferase component n=1 Tax=Absidia repens TaxID=90262 RepID=A0A1X2IZY6_9FUNG|nr:hypothetical protein BCR42DRAFT_314577 [Absidia repens]